MREGWVYKKLGEVCEHKEQVLRAAKLFTPNEKIDYIDISSIDNRLNIISSTTPFVFCEAPSRAQQKVEKGDILISLVRPNLKNIAIIQSDDNKLVASSGFCVLRSHITINNRYIFYIVRGEKFTNYLIARVQGANYPAVREDDIKGFPIPVPPLSEQQRIVSELDLLSSIIEKKKAQLKEYDQLAQSIFYDMFGDPVSNEKGWEVKKLGEVAKEKLSYGSGASAVPYDNEIRYVRITDIKDDGELNCDMVSPNTYDDKYLLNDGDILFARSGATVGKTFLYKEKYGKCIYAGYLIRLIPNAKIVIPSYVYGFTKSPYYRSFVAKTQNAVAQPNINAKQYSELSIPLPPLTLQQSFASKIEAIERQKALVQQSITEAETLFNSRMDFWFS